MADNRMSFEIPSEFKDEEKWLKVFSKNSFIVLAIGVVVVLGWVKFWGIFGFNTFGMVTGVIALILVVVSTMIPVKSGKVLAANGIALSSLILTKLLHKRGRRIYIKGINKYEEPEGFIEEYTKEKAEYEKELKRKGGVSV